MKRTLGEIEKIKFTNLDQGLKIHTIGIKKKNLIERISSSIIKLNIKKANGLHEPIFLEKKKNI